VVAAAGNEATHVAYPASIRPAVFSVGALGRIGSFPADSAHSLKIGRYRDASGQFFSAAFSNFGDELDVIAPGVAITSTVPKGFAAWDGTSMACPLVTGVAAVVLAASPWLRSGDWRQVAALQNCLRNSVTPLGLPASVQGLGVPHAARACDVARSVRL
jgi:subtilisin